MQENEETQIISINKFIGQQIDLFCPRQKDGRQFF
jgi:hypothetical protein